MEWVKRLKARFMAGTLLMRLIYINVLVWLVIRLVVVVAFLAGGSAGGLLAQLEVPSDALAAATHPWTLLTYQFAHYDLLHILFNMLWLYWMGRIFVAFFVPKQLGGLYVLGGLGGALLYLAAYNTLPALASQQAFLIGASASVMAIVVAIAAYVPNFKIGLLFIGQVPLKWMAAVMIVLDLLSITSGNAGGHIAHLGGALVGLWFALAMQRGHDITSWLNRGIDHVVSLFKRRERRGPVGRPVRGGASYHYSPPVDEPAGAGLDEQRLDEILGKLKQSGYAALTDDEKEFLFTASRKR